MESPEYISFLLDKFVPDAAEKIHNQALKEINHMDIEDCRKCTFKKIANFLKYECINMILKDNSQKYKKNIFQRVLRTNSNNKKQIKQINSVIDSNFDAVMPLCFKYIYGFPDNVEDFVNESLALIIKKFKEISPKKIFDQKIEEEKYVTVSNPNDLPPAIYLRSREYLKNFEPEFSITCTNIDLPAALLVNKLSNLQDTASINSYNSTEDMAAGTNEKYLYCDYENLEAKQMEIEQWEVNEDIEDNSELNLTTTQNEGNVSPSVKQSSIKADSNKYLNTLIEVEKETSAPHSLINHDHTDKDDQQQNFSLEPIILNVFDSVALPRYKSEENIEEIENTSEVRLFISKILSASISDKGKSDAGTSSISNKFFSKSDKGTSDAGISPTTMQNKNKILKTFSNPEIMNDVAPKDTNLSIFEKLGNFVDPEDDNKEINSEEIFNGANIINQYSRLNEKTLIKKSPKEHGAKNLKIFSDKELKQARYLQVIYNAEKIEQERNNKLKAKIDEKRRRAEEQRNQCTIAKKTGSPALIKDARYAMTIENANQIRELKKQETVARLAEKEQRLQERRKQQLAQENRRLQYLKAKYYKERDLNTNFSVEKFQREVNKRCNKYVKK